MGTGIVMQDNSTSYIGAELMEFLGPKGGQTLKHEEDSRSGVSPLLDQAVISFNHLMGGTENSQSHNI